MAEPEYLYVARISKPKGLKGLVIARILTDYPENLTSDKRLYLLPPLPEMATLTLQNIKIKGDWGEILFKGIDNIEKAEKLRDKFLGIKTIEAEVLPEDTFWEHQLIGLEVKTIKGKNLGLLVDILRTGSNDVYTVKDKSGKEYLIPALKKVIKKVDLERGQMLIDPINGLLEGDNIED